jgi:post-segregation antitoxin (ccd killing protein)
VPDCGLDLSRSTLAKIESRVRCVTDRELIQLARVLKVPVSDFFASK